MSIAMDPKNNLENVEKAEGLVAAQQGAVLEEPLDKPAQQRTSNESNESSRSQITRAEEEAENLEALAPAVTGPVYSAFGKWEKRYIVFMVTWAAFISPTSANIYFPALNPLAEDLHVSNTIINLTLTAYMIFQGLAPTVFGDLSDMAGRRPAYIGAMVVYIAANIGLALQNSYAALFLLRCLQSCGSSGAIALGMGVVADIASSSERGHYMGIVGAGTMMGPALGPVIGGILAQFRGWRSIFWFLMIFGTCWLIPFALTVPETGRNVVGNGSIAPRGWNMSLVDWLRTRKAAREESTLTRTKSAEGRRLAQAELTSKRQLRWPNPLKTVHIIMEKDVAVVLFYNALIYTAFYDVTASLPSLFAEIYHFNDLQVGLCYLPFGAGCAIASFINGKMLDRNYKRVARQIGFTIDRKRGDDLRNFPIERARIELIWPMLSVGLAAILCYGWVLEKEAHLAAPLVLTFLVGFCVNGSFNILSTLLVDLYPKSPATATAANNLVRCFIGAGGTGIINIMIKGMGRGWCFTFISLVCVVTMPMLMVEIKWGPTWREERRVRIEREEEAKEKAAVVSGETTETESRNPSPVREVSEK